MPPSPKLHRWLDLIACLAGRRLPLSVEQLMESIPAYAHRWRSEDPTARDSVRRMFERDKDELRSLGIPIETVGFAVTGDAGRVEGYRLVRRDFYLPYLRLLGGAQAEPAAPRDGAAGPPAGTLPAFDLEEDEAVAAVEGLRHLSELPAFPLAREARSAYRKLTFDLDPGRFPHTPVAVLPPPGAAETGEVVRLLADALLARKRVSFRYQGIRRNQVSERDVAPYGLVYLQGHWYLAGDDRLRGAVRLFRVSRMEGVRVNSHAPHTADYVVPADFDVRAYAGRRAWELGDEEERALPVRVLFRFPSSLWAERSGFGEVVERRPDGATVHTFQVRDTAPFLRWILGLEGEAEVQLPAELKWETARLAGAVAALHGEAPRG